MKITSCILATVLISIGSTCLSANQSNLQIKQLTNAEDGMYIRFSIRPNTCTSQYQGYHAVIPRTQPNFNGLYLKLMRIKAIRQKVSITYIDRGNCDKANSTLLISAIGRN